MKGVVLAAGAGTRLRPLTLRTPKPLLPVGGRPLLAWAIERVTPYVDEVAVNVHHLADQMVEALSRLPVGVPLHISVESPQALGTAGALGRLRDWVDGAPVLLTNADAWYPPAARPVLDDLVAGWDGNRVRLLCVPAAGDGDFDDRRYVGTALLPWWSVQSLDATPSGLYEVSWAALHARGELDLVVAEDLVAVDCGTPGDLARADELAAAVSGSR